MRHIIDTCDESNLMRVMLSVRQSWLNPWSNLHTNNIWCCYVACKVIICSDVSCHVLYERLVWIALMILGDSFSDFTLNSNSIHILTQLHNNCCMRTKWTVGRSVKQYVAPSSLRLRMERYDEACLRVSSLYRLIEIWTSHVHTLCTNYQWYPNQLVWTDRWWFGHDLMDTLTHQSIYNSIQLTNQLFKLPRMRRSAGHQQSCRTS